MKKSKHQQDMEREARNSWRNFERLIRERLESIDNMTRTMTSEMRTLGVKQSYIDTFLPEKFNQLCKEILAKRERGLSSENT